MKSLKGLLSKLELTNLEANVYEILYKNAKLDATTTAKKLDKPVESIHRTINKLKSKGFITSNSDYPQKHYVIPMDTIINNKILELGGLLAEYGEKISGKHPSQKTNLIKYIPNRETHHIIGENLFNRLKNEVLIIASGTGEFKPSFFASMVKINKAGKKHRIIAMSYDESNVEKLTNWKNNGIQIRYKKGKALNLIIYDRELIQIALRTKEGSREKEGLLINNKDLATFLGEFHDYLWKNSSEIV
ncbi:MAG: hypothetical protein JXA53_01820 [Bacteroidales bacterium]|nr:hypothetical protein [Bacteroidales bacterium]